MGEPSMVWNNLLSNLDNLNTFSMDFQGFRHIWVGISSIWTHVGYIVKEVHTFRMDFQHIRDGISLVSFVCEWNFHGVDTFCMEFEFRRVRDFHT